jgi:lysophospholipase L1-like esterase
VFTGAKVSAAPAAELAAYRAVQDAAKQRDWADRCRYRADDARVAALPPREHRVVFMGDSITEAWGVADPAFFTAGRINRGISGQTTAQMLLRFQADVVALHPATVHILAGTNDLAGNTGPVSMQDIENNFVAMATLAKANGIRVMLASGPPAAKFPWKPGIAPAQQIETLNAWLKTYAHRIGATYIDYYPLLRDAEGGMQPGLTIDGVHPNAAGYRAITPLSASLTR